MIDRERVANQSCFMSLKDDFGGLDISTSHSPDPRLLYLNKL